MVEIASIIVIIIIIITVIIMLLDVSMEIIVLDSLLMWIDVDSLLVTTNPITAPPVKLLFPIVLLLLLLLLLLKWRRNIVDIMVGVTVDRVAIINWLYTETDDTVIDRGPVTGLCTYAVIRIVHCGRCI